MPSVARPAEVRVVVYGDRLVAHHLDELGFRAVEARPAMEEIYLTILDIVDEIFDSQGARGGDAPWQPVSPTWLERKVRLTGEPRILHFHHKLRESVTKFRHPDQYARVQRDKVVFGSRLPYAEVHQKGGKRFHATKKSATLVGADNVEHSEWIGEGIPQRQYIKFTGQDARAFGREVMRFMMGAFH